jgi:GMP synthase-like glutamine amidotransferase
LAAYNTTVQGSRILVVEHEADSGAVMLAERAEEMGFAVQVCTPKTGIPRESTGYSMIMPMGASPSVNDEHIRHWFADELALLRHADSAGVPIFGVCFGAQAMAVALGGSVERASAPEIGWFEVQTSEPKVIEPGPWFEWHVDAITPPPGSTVLATTGVGVQAYSLRNHLGLQFHPEVTSREIRAWCSGEPDTLRRLDIDPNELLRIASETASQSRKRAYGLFDGFIKRVGLR